MEKIKNIMIYFILIPFLFPKGFAEYYSSYRNFYLIWLAGSLILMLLYIGNYFLLKKGKIDRFIYFVCLYYGVFLGITLFNKGELGEGIQKLLVTPIFIIFFLIYIKKYPKVILKSITNILILLFVLNICFYPIFKYGLNSYHIYFLGHVQMYSQISILGIFVSYLGQFYFRKGKKFKTLRILSLCTLLLSQTAASYICLGLYFIFYFLNHFKADYILRLKPKSYFFIFIFLNIFLVWYSIGLESISFQNSLLSLSGRTFIWKDAYGLILDKPFMGYGAYGVLLKPFWSSWSIDAGGFNYAHNELIQRLLDGGILLLIDFLILLFLGIKDLKNIGNKSLYKVAIVTLIMFMSIMLIESVTEYYFYFTYLVVLFSLPKIDKKLVRGSECYGLYCQC
ncbi:MAG: O-antigen ligase family protein [Acholeplasmatales bacterium]|jgi:O-antigen ligase|nr:O-antigen ligase family protein [Acholeplasmatales bacterium]